jgi:hypothetical protein
MYDIRMILAYICIYIYTYIQYIYIHRFIDIVLDGINL